MSDAFTSAAREDRNVLERLIKGLPGISGYADKELRRNADYRLRQLIAGELEAQRTSLLAVQNQLLKGGGLAYLTDVDSAVNRLQTLTDKVRTAAYGYAGLFDAVRVREEELDALHRFDVAMLQAVAGLDAAVAALQAGLADRATLGAAIAAAAGEVDALSRLFERRSQAILSPELLTSAGYAPQVRAPEGGDFDLSPAAPLATGAKPATAPEPPSAAAFDAGDFTLTPTGTPAAPSGPAETPSGFELIDKP